MANCISPLYVNGSFVPCGKCNYCLQRLRGEWSFRIGQELRAARAAAFITLTYTEDQLPKYPGSGLPTLVKRDHQLFMKSLRKFQHKYLYSGEVKGVYEWPSIRYYGVGEYSDIGRPHYHYLIFNVHRQVVTRIGEIWKKGRCHVGSVELRSIHYVTGYVMNKYKEVGGREPPFQVISNRSGGIGKSYLDKMTSYHKSGEIGYVTLPGGFRANLPKYYKNKIFTNKVTRDRMRLANIFRGDQEYRKEVERLKLIHPNPEAYLEESLAYHHERIGKALRKSKIQ